MDTGNCITDEYGEIVCLPITEEQLEIGLSGEAEVICADASEPGCEVEPELWPMWLSLGALAATAIIVLLLNLFNRKKS